MVMRMLAVVLCVVCVGAARADGLRVIDGDTIDFDGIPVRILEIDTAETFRPRCQREKVLGLAAKARLIALLGDGSGVRFDAAGYDRFGRVLGRVFVGSVNVADVLLAEGHAVRYTKGPEAKAWRLRHWCPQ